MAEGTIFKRTGRKTWSLQLDFGRDPITNKRLRESYSGFPTKRAAQEKRHELLARAQRGAHIAPARATIGEYLTEWLQRQKSQLRPGAWESYDTHLRTHVIATVGNIPLQKLEPTHLNRLYSQLLESGRCRGKGGLSPRTVRYVHSLVLKALKDAGREGLLLTNAASRATPPAWRQARPKTPDAWSADELRRFLDSTEGHPLHALFVLAATTGMRRGEIVGLRWRDVDLEARRLSVVQTIVTLRGRQEVSTPKTDKGSRTVALDESTVAILRTHRTASLQQALQLGRRVDGDTLVFCKPTGEALNANGVSQKFLLAARKAELRRIRFHDLRHTHATLALQAGVHPKVVCERLGHSSITVTLDTYSHAIPAMQADAADTVAALVFG